MNWTKVNGFRLHVGDKVTGEIFDELFSSKPCRDVKKGFLCNLRVGHSGSHVATEGKRILLIWKGRKK
jgi:hypothetical protein